MSPYVAGGLLVAFIAWSGFIYHRGHVDEEHICSAADATHDAAQAAVTIDAQKHVIGVIQQQSNIAQETSNDFTKNMSIITDQYAISPDLLQSTPAPTGHSMPPLPSATAGVGTSKVYHLTFQQCDREEAKLNDLWNRDNRLAAIK